MLVNMKEMLLDAQRRHYAVGLFNTAVNLVLLFVVNKISAKASDVNFV